MPLPEGTSSISSRCEYTFGDVGEGGLGAGGGEAAGVDVSMWEGRGPGVRDSETQET